MMNSIIECPNCRSTDVVKKYGAGAKFQFQGHICIDCLTIFQCLLCFIGEPMIEPIDIRIKTIRKAWHENNSLSLTHTRK